MNESQEFLAQFGYEVATYLGDWYVGEVQDTAVKLDGPDGMQMVLWSGGIDMARGNTDFIKFQVSGEYPPDTFIMPEDKPTINVSYKRGAKGVAGDIRRRFLSKYVPLYYEKWKVQQEIDRNRSARRRLLTDLAGAFSWKIADDKDGLIKRVEESYGGSKLDAHYTTRLEPESERRWEVDLELKSLTVDQALRIADVLKEPRFPPEQLELL